MMFMCGCSSIGPKTVARDRSDYSNAISDSWKSQTLLNIVKMRYLDLPIWLDIGQVVAGYSLETTANVGGQVSSSSAIQGNSLMLGAQGRYTDRPTITYTPLTGEKFLEGFLAPIEPSKIFFLIQAGYPADFLLELSTESFGGFRNYPSRFGATRKADAEFFRLSKLFGDVQDAGAVGIQVQVATNQKPAMVVFFHNDRIEPEIQANIDEARQLLGAKGPPSPLTLVNSPLRGRPGEMTVGTRSLFQILMALGNGVDIPATHLERGLTTPTPSTLKTHPPLLRVHSGAEPPDDRYVAIAYEGEWFWIANDDLRSKRTFSSILFMFSLADVGSSEALPTITIPAQ